MASRNYLNLNTEFWRKARMQALVRDNFTCQAHHFDLCNSPCEESRLSHLHVHHIKMRINSGTHDLDNLITLCKYHHEQIHPWMKKQKSFRSVHLELSRRTL